MSILEILRTKYETFYRGYNTPQFKDAVLKIYKNAAEQENLKVKQISRDIVTSQTGLVTGLFVLAATATIYECARNNLKIDADSTKEDQKNIIESQKSLIKEQKTLIDQLQKQAIVETNHIIPRMPSKITPPKKV